MLCFVPVAFVCSDLFFNMKQLNYYLNHGFAVKYLIIILDWIGITEVAIYLISYYEFYSIFIYWYHEFRQSWYNKNVGKIQRNQNGRKTDIAERDNEKCLCFNSKGQFYFLRRESNCLHSKHCMQKARGTFTAHKEFAMQVHV